LRTFPKALAAAPLAALMVLPRPARGQDDHAARPYAQAGLIELGGFAHFMAAKDYSALGLFPTFGWFAWDNVELSAIVGLTRVGEVVEVREGVSAGVSRTQLLLLGEPSFHLPFSETVYGFVGLGLGLAHQARSPGPGAGPGFALAPRLGLNLVIAHSAVFTPALQASYQTNEALGTPNGGALAAHSSFAFQAGYTIIW